jgi:hypothetical protein
MATDTFMVLVGVYDDPKIERAMERVEKVMVTELKADADEIERDVKAADEDSAPVES